MNLSRQAAGVVVATLVGLFYGLSLVVARMSLDHGAGVLTIVALRYGVLCGLLWLMLFSRTFYCAKGPSLWAMGCGLLALITALSYLAAVKYIPVSLGTLVFYTHPLITVLLAAFFAGERSTWTEIAATAVAFTGLVAVLEVSFASLHPFGIALGMVASVGAAVVFVLSARIMTALNPLVFTFFMAVGATLVAIVGIIFQGGADIPESGLGLALMAGAVLLNVVGLLGMFVSVRLIGPVATPMMLNIEPVTAIVFAMLLLSETMTMFQMFGAAVVIVMVLIAQVSRSRRGDDAS